MSLGEMTVFPLRSGVPKKPEKRDDRIPEKQSWNKCVLKGKGIQISSTWPE